MGFNGDTYIWKDRKRYLGMPLSFTRYALSEDRLFLSVGFLSVTDEEILLYRIRDISMKRTLGQRLFGVGTLTIASSDKSTPILTLKNVKDPFDVKELLHQSVEECKLKRRVRINELMEDHGNINPSDALEDDDFPEDDIPEEE
jgi:uncharacterized membrane protein YdbT with pleckstrin-like domain